MQRIGIGYEDYKRFVDEKLYYIDKTWLVADIIKKGGQVTLFTRPRRFGKTLTLSMLRTFFEQEYDSDGNAIDNSRYFEGMKIMDADDEVLSQMGSYPVIKMSLKSAKRPTFAGALMTLVSDIISELRRHDYLLDSPLLSEDEKQKLKDLLSGDLEWYSREMDRKSSIDRASTIIEGSDKYATAIRLLSEYLKKHHGRNVIILLDEYDVPLENAYYCGFYDEMVGFIRSLFESSLKTNDALERAVVTGCLRISRESIFTGLNNLTINSIMNDDFGEGFGFTQDETESMLRAYGLTDKIEEVKNWYDGYLFGSSEVYNPWSVISYVDSKVNGGRKFPQPFWSNTSSNSIVRDLVNKSSDKVKEELDILLNDGSIEKCIHENITYDDIYSSEDNLWNFLFFTGYMKKMSERSDGQDIYVTMCIPNLEIKSIYRDQVRLWFENIVENTDRNDLHEAVASRDGKQMGRILTSLLKKSISTFDSSESFYHGYLLSMLVGMTDYSARSNREAGDGRPDIILYPLNPPDPAYIIEIKVKKKFNEMQDGLDEALKQIHDRNYEEGILEEGYAGAIAVGVCFCKKSCIVEVEK